MCKTVLIISNVYWGSIENNRISEKISDFIMCKWNTIEATQFMTTLLSDKNKEKNILSVEVEARRKKVNKKSWSLVLN